MKNLDIKGYYDVNRTIEPTTHAIRDTFQIQSDALALMATLIDQEQYLRALDLIEHAQGHVIVCGMGKSGHVGKKMAATLASTGTPSFFLHPSEAFHGDLGMITKEDVIILISNSGETDEVLQLIPSLQNFGNAIIAITAQADSTLAFHANAVLLIHIDKEACPNNLAPTTSTTVTIAIGDALAVALMQRRRFEPNDFARFHPGGQLGRRLLTRVKDVMKTDNLPIVEQGRPLTEAIVKMNESRLGVAIVVDNDRLKGIITDGDLRRAFAKRCNMAELKAQDVMTESPKYTYPSDMLIDAEAVMQRFQVSSLVVLDEHQQVSGLVQIYHL